MSLDDVFFLDEPAQLLEDTDGVDDSSSTCSEEEETNPDQANQEEPGWTTVGALQMFEFSNIARFNVGQAESPIDFFNALFNSTFFEILVDSTNSNGLRMMSESQYTYSRAMAWKDTNVDEIRVFIALLFHMGHIRLNRLTDYWNTDVLYSLNFNKFMPRDRFLLILRNLTFDNPSDSKAYSSTDPTRFVRSIIIFFNALMKDLVCPSKDLTIDESLVLWRGRLKLRQYIRGNSHKYGIKLYVLTDTNGLTQKMHMCCGSHEVQAKSQAERVVMILLEDYLNAGRSLYTDNIYNSVTLAEKLLDNATYLTGTLRANREGNPLITRYKPAKGTCLVRYNASGVCVTNYRDNRSVLMISTEHHSNLVQYKNRHNEVTDKPTVIVEYNKYMKGIDRKNQMLSYHPSIIKSTKWYTKILIHVMQVMLLNAFMMFNEQNKSSGANNKGMNLLDYRLNVIKKLLNPEVPADRQANIRKRRVVPPSSSLPSGTKIKTDRDDDIHLPEELPKNNNGKTKRKDCKHCFTKLNVRKASLFYCPLCDKQPALCLKCFREYHNY